MIFGLLYDPLDDANFILGRFREIKKNLQPVFKKKNYLVEGDMEKYLKNKNINWTFLTKDKTIKKNKKITIKNDTKFHWSYKKDKKFEFHIMTTFGASFRCYSFDIPGFEAVMEFNKENNYLQLRTSDAISGTGETSSKATKLAEFLEENYKFKNYSSLFR